jgi:hypothetical protein
MLFALVPVVHPGLARINKDLTGGAVASLNEEVISDYRT